MSIILTEARCFYAYFLWKEAGGGGFGDVGVAGADGGGGVSYLPGCGGGRGIGDGDGGGAWVRAGERAACLWGGSAAAGRIGADDCDCGCLQRSDHPA